MSSYIGGKQVVHDSDWRKRPRKAPDKRLQYNFSFRVTPELYEKVKKDAETDKMEIAAKLRRIVEAHYGI